MAVTATTPAPKLTVAIFELIYKKGGMLHQLHFEEKDKKTAIRKGQDYCELKNLKFITVNEWLQNIDDLIEHSTEERA